MHTQIIIDDNITEIQYIYHLSDIHIRNNERHTEYLEVFNLTYETLKQEISINPQSLIVVTGDILDTTETDFDGAYIALCFLENLAKIAPTIIIAGNHDCNLANTSDEDILTKILRIRELQNLYYLKDSGIYQYHNIMFGVSSLIDSKFVKAENIYHNRDTGNNYKIALYHGFLKDPSFKLSYSIEKAIYEIDDFNNYDYVMLGDIHKHLYVNNIPTIAYAGSLIQQKYKETIDNHGILKWNLATKQSNLIEVHNNYGFYTIKICNERIVEMPKISKKATIKFSLEDTRGIYFDMLLKKLHKRYDIISFKIKKNKFTKCLREIDPQPYQYSTKENNHTNIVNSYFNSQNITNEWRKKLLRLHTEITDNKLKLSDIVTKPWKILKLKFSNLLSYGENNVIDFRKHQQNQIIGIIGQNNHGKSALIDIILFCLFEKCGRERDNIFNINAVEMSCSLTIEMHGTVYKISRNGKIDSKTHIMTIIPKFSKITTDAENNKSVISLNESLKRHTDKKIAKLFGTYKNFTNICIYLQQPHVNFIDMTPCKKKEHLNEILNLNIFKNYHDNINKKCKMLSAEYLSLKHKVQSTSKNQLTKEIKLIEEYILKLKVKRYKINQFLNQFSSSPYSYRLDIQDDKLLFIQLKINKYIRMQKSSNTAYHTVSNKLTELLNKSSILTKRSLKMNLSITSKLIRKMKNLNKEIIDTSFDFLTITDKKKQIATKLRKYTYLLKKYNKEFLEEFYKHKIISLNAKTELNKTKLNSLQEQFNKYDANLEKCNKLGDKVELYQMYCDMIGNEGLSQEIFKIKLPLIENEVNNILQKNYNFKIKIILYDGLVIKGSRKLTPKCISINIYRPDMPHYNVQAACGFEKLLITLAFRIVFYHFTCDAKPNFFIIDEALGCLDKEHLENIGIFLNYMKTQFDHIYIVSHQEQIHEHSSSLIKIKKDGEFSQISEEHLPANKQLIIEI